MANIITRLFKRSTSQGASSSSLQRQLMTIVHGNKTTADRLVSYEKRRNPGKTEQWYLEKVIYDLRR
ncbi:MAG: hypothetical protein WA883_21665 [Phormidesmis sp.]